MSGSIWFVGLLFFSYSFPANLVPPKIFYLWLVPAGLIFILAPFHLFVSDFVINENGYLQPVNNLTFFIPFMAIFFSYILYSIMLICRNYKNYKHNFQYRMQFRYLLFGLSIFIFSIIFFDTILPGLGIYKFNILGPASGILFFIFTAYAILKHNLLDIRIIIQRGLIYIFLLSVIVGVYIISLQLLAYFLHTITNTNSIISAGFVMVLGILFFQPIESYFRKITDPIFFKDHYNYAEALHKLSIILYTNITKADIVKYSRAMLEEILKPEWVKFNFLKGKFSTDGFVDDRSLSIPIIFQGEEIGELSLGPKKSGDFYNSRDMQLLKTFVYQAAVALEKGRLYEKVEEYSTHLEQLVEERTSEIKKIQEEQRQEMIDISHNLQTPLAVIKCELELFADSHPDNEKIYEVKKSINKVSQFIRKLLHLAKLENDTFEVELIPLNFTALIKENVDYFEVMTEESGIKLISSITSGKVLILGNKRLLTELLINLINNSIKYRTSDEESIIEISLFEEEKDVKLIVSDNGMGISEKDLPHIFTRFYRGFQKKNIKGTGLGLAICKKIMDKHGGKISASSSKEQTSFTMIFPKIQK